MPTYVVPKLTRVANASEKKRMGDVIRLMSRQLGEAMMDSLGVRVEDHFYVSALTWRKHWLILAVQRILSCVRVM